MKFRLSSSTTLEELALKLALIRPDYLQLIPEQDEWISVGKIDGSYSVIIQVIKPGNEEMSALGSYIVNCAD